MADDCQGDPAALPPAGWVGHLARWSSARVVVVVAPLLAVLLALPALGGGRQLEEWSAQGPSARGDLATILRDVAVGVPPPPLPVQRAHSYLAKDNGYVPWYASPELRVAFRRPLAGLTHWFDDRVAPGDTRFAHAHSLAWLFAFVLVGALVLRRVLGPGPAAGVAAIVLACDDSRGLPVGWLSNRTALVSWTLGLVALLAQDLAIAAARGRAARLALTATAGFALWLALAAGEYGVGAGAWLFAHAVFVDRRPWKDRVAALAPSAVAVVAWAAAYVASGAGARGSGAYLSPLVAPVHFVTEGAARALLLLAGAFGPPLEPPIALPPAWWPWALGGLWLLLAASTAGVAWLAARSTAARFFALGAVASVVPLVGALPAERLLGLTTLGVAGLVALAVWEAVAPAGPVGGRVRTAFGALTGVWLLSHVVLAAALAPAKSRGLARQAAQVRALAASALEGVPPGAHLVLVNAPGAYLGAELVHAIRSLSLAPPDRVRVLHGGEGRLELERIDARTFAIAPAGGFCSALHAGVYFSPATPWAVDSGVQLRGVRVLVDAIDSTGCPTRARFAFARDLEDERVVVKHLVGGEYRRLALPAPGQRAQLGGSGAAPR